MGNCLGLEAPSSKNNCTNNNAPVTKPNLKVYTSQELRCAIENFKNGSVLEEGRVYKGWIDETTLEPSEAGVGLPVAIKKCIPHTHQGLKEWKAEIDLWGKFVHPHPNLIQLIGYCYEEKEQLLVYECMQHQSLESHLFQNKKVCIEANKDPLCWSTRMKIAIDAARGLEFLHTTEINVIYRDFKAANILLDENYNTKLSNFGFATTGPLVGKTYVTTEVVGTYGYAAPVYINTGFLYVKSDVYGFGVVLLEMLTGLRAYDLSRPSGQTSLVDWYRPMLNKKSKLKRIVDRRMQDYPPEACRKLAQLILRCLQNNQNNRPAMSEVVSILESVNTIKMNPKASKASFSKSSINGHD